MNRTTILAVVAVIAIAAAGLGWVAGQKVKSPAEVAAQTEAPEPSLITVPIEQRALSSNVVVRGQAQFDDATDLTVSASTSGASIITRVTKESGQQLAEGDVVIEVAGRPVIVLQGELPAFRSLTPTLVGPDVRQLEEALVRLGFDPGTVDETFDTATEEAVAALYREAGYTPDEPTSDELAAVNGARDSVEASRSSVRDAQRALSESGVSESEKLSLDQSVRGATERRDDAVTQAAIDKSDAAATTVLAQSDLDVAIAANVLAQTRLTAAKDGIHPDTGLAPTADELVALETAATEATADETAAASALDDATSAEATVGIQADRGVVDAGTELAIAEAVRTESLTRASGTDIRAQLTDAQKRLGEAEADLAKVEAEVGIEFPANELIFLPALPREIQRVNVDAGDEPQGPVMRVTGSGVVVRSAVSATDRPLIVEGATAIMENDDLGISIEATVAFVATTPGGGEISSDRYGVRFEPNEPLPEEGFDQNYRITIPIESTSGDVLVVPLAALSAGADGKARVEVETAPGESTIVDVSPGLSSQGFVEIVPLGDVVLNVGDRVVVGRDLAPNGSAESGSDDENDESSGG